MPWTATPSDNLTTADRFSERPAESPLRIIVDITNCPDGTSSSVKLKYHFKWIYWNIATVLSNCTLIYRIEHLVTGVRDGGYSEILDSFESEDLEKAEVQLEGKSTTIHTAGQAIRYIDHRDKFCYRLGGSKLNHIKKWGFIGIMLAAKSRDLKWYHRPSIARAIRAWRGTFVDKFMLTFTKVEGDESSQIYDLQFTKSSGRT